MAKKKRLGRGLDALLSKPAPSRETDDARSGGATLESVPTEPLESRPSAPGGDGLRSLPVEWLQRGEYQPRADMRQESLEDLARSIEAQGVVQPIVVRSLKDSAGEGRYEIIAGERRWRAAQLAGLAEIPAIVREIDDESAVAMALIENIQREDLNPLEEAGALKRLIDEFGLTHADAATAVGRSRAAVSNLLRLLDLSDKVRALLEARELEMGHARALLALADPGKQLEAAREVIRKGLSVRATEQLVRRLQKPAASAQASGGENGSADIRHLEKDIADRLGAKVRIEHSKKGFGKLTISYNSLDELDGILNHIK